MLSSVDYTFETILEYEFAFGNVMETSKTLAYVAKRMTVTLTVDGMACDGCEANVETALADVSGVTSVSADHEAATVAVEGDVDVDALVAAVTEAGYEAHSK